MLAIKLFWLLNFAQYVKIWIIHKILISAIFPGTYLSCCHGSAPASVLAQIGRNQSLFSSFGQPNWHRHTSWSDTKVISCLAILSQIVPAIASTVSAWKITLCLGANWLTLLLCRICSFYPNDVVTLGVAPGRHLSVSIRWGITCLVHEYKTFVMLLIQITFLPLQPIYWNSLV